MTTSLTALMLILVLLNPSSSSEAARKALSIWGLDVVPSLFPYMVLCRMLTNQLKETRIPAIPVILLAGLAGGSPSGALILASYSSRIRKKHILPLCALTGTISPMFFLGTIRSWMDQTAPVLRLLSAHWAGAALCACILMLLPAKKEDVCYPHTHSAPAYSPIAESVNAVLSVGGCIVFYSAAAGILRSLRPFEGLWGIALHGILEMAGGVHALLASDIASSHSAAILLTAVTGFSGFSILTQNLVFLHPLGVHIRQLLGIAILRMLLSAAAMILFLWLFP